MVTVGEARYDLDKAKQELEMQKSLTQAKQLEIQSVQLPQVPQRQLQTRKIMDIIKVVYIYVRHYLEEELYILLL